MRLIITLLMTALLTGNYSHAQNLRLNKTNRLFKNHAYKVAITNYKNLDVSREVLENLADSYYYTNDFENAAKTYTQIKNQYSDITDKKRVYRFAQSLLAI